ncbi:MAG TPA: DsbA family protein [Longimicrobiaceae bacterium]|nr:DsbA family protein [Longimicrobiaceae bacterium]
MIGNLSSAILVVCAVIVTSLVVRREFFARPVGAQPAVREVEEWAGLDDVGNVMGSRAAPLQIVEFSDFQCPFCAKVKGDLKKLREKYGDRVAVVYRHFPLTAIHPHAVAAAVASECAGAQGRFEPYHDALFAQQDSIGKKGWSDFARVAGVPDLQEFDACTRSEQVQARVAEDVEAAKKAEVDGTPSFVFQGKMISGSGAPEQLDRWIAEALKGS